MVDKTSNIIEFEEGLSNLIECSICTETFKDPKVLSCLHTFCKCCLDKLADNFTKSAGEEIPCPICRKKFLIPEEGIDGLQKNFFVVKLIEMTRNLNPSLIQNVCESCKDQDSSGSEGNLPMAEVYCIDCRQKICKVCHNYHLRNKALREHKFAPLKDHQQNIERVCLKSVIEVCHQHNTRPVDIYCFNCMDTVCSICFIENHKTHEGTSVGSAVNELQEKIADDVDVLSKCESELQMKETKCEEDRNEFDEKMNALENEIRKSRDENLKKMEHYKEDIQSLLINVDGFKSYCEQFFTIAPASIICKEVRSLTNRAVELQKLCDQQIQCNFEFPDFQLSEKIKLKSGNSVTEEEDQQIRHQGEFDSDISALEFRNSESHKEMKTLKETDPNSARKIRDLEQQVSLLRSIAFGENPMNNNQGDLLNYGVKPKSDTDFYSISRRSASTWSILGMTILQNDFIIAISADSSVAVELYERETLDFKSRWSNKKLSEIKDMAGCKKSNSLYFMTETPADQKNEISKFSLDGTLIKFWTVEDAVGQLSITDEANVLFTVWNKCILQEFTADGQLERSIPLSWNFGFCNPWHAIKLNSSHYLVSHGDWNDSIRRICLMDLDGKVLKYFGDSDYGDKLRCPTYIEKDLHNNVIIADSALSLLTVFSCGLEQINAKFQHFQGDGRVSHRPQRLAIDGWKKRVFVAVSLFRYKFGSDLREPRDSVTVLTVDSK